MELWLPLGGPDARRQTRGRSAVRVPMARPTTVPRGPPESSPRPTAWRVGWPEWPARTEVLVPAARMRLLLGVGVCQGCLAHGRVGGGSGHEGTDKDTARGWVSLAFGAAAPPDVSAQRGSLAPPGLRVPATAIHCPGLRGTGRSCYWTATRGARLEPREGSQAPAWIQLLCPSCFLPREQAWALGHTCPRPLQPPPAGAWGRACPPAGASSLGASSLG